MIIYDTPAHAADVVVPTPVIRRSSDPREERLPIDLTDRDVAELVIDQGHICPSSSDHGVREIFGTRETSLAERILPST
jgi:hypothetical protein